MRIKSAYKYQLFELRKPVFIYYLVIVAISILFIVLAKVWHSESMISGFDAATVIFLFVCGLNAFRQPFHMLMANGISRRTMFVSTVAAFGTVSVGMALIDRLLGLITSLIVPYNTAFAFQFAEQYGLAGGAGVTLPMIADGFVWAVFSYMAAAMVGLFITTAYYRMNKALKLLVSIGVPVFALIVLPILDVSLFGGVVTQSIYRFLFAATTLLGEGNPYSFVLFSTFCILICGGLVWLLMRRANVKS